MGLVDENDVEVHQVPSRLRVRSFWSFKYRNRDLELPDKRLRESFKAERNMGLILLRLRWGRRTYKLVVNEDDRLELRELGDQVWS